MHGQHVIESIGAYASNSISNHRPTPTGWQILCHANGDAASDRFIAAIRKAKQKHPGVDNRPVLIHGQVLREDQVDALEELEIFPLLFPILGRLPPRLGHWPRARERGMMFGSHHDAPVACPAWQHFEEKTKGQGSERFFHHLFELDKRSIGRVLYIPHMARKV